MTAVRGTIAAGKKAPALEGPLARHSFETILRRLARAGFRRDFVAAALLPEWWEPECANDAALLPEIEIRVARFLNLSVSALRDPAFQISPPAYAGAQLRRVRGMDGHKLAPAIHAAIQVASAVARSLQSTVPPPRVPLADGLAWREALAPTGGGVRLQDLLDDLWQRGIPVVPIETLPSPSFQGLACIVEGRPVVLLAHKYDEPGRVAFLIAHEVGHVAAGDCAPEAPVVDEQEDTEDDTDTEQKADRFATRLLVGSDAVPQVEGADYGELAKKAAQIERTQGADAGAVVFAWARRSLDYATATRAVKALYRASGARRALQQHFDKWVDLDAAAESDRDLLRCVFGNPTRNANPD